MANPPPHTKIYDKITYDGGSFLELYFFVQNVGTNLDVQNSSRRFEIYWYGTPKAQLWNFKSEDRNPGQSSESLVNKIENVSWNFTGTYNCQTTYVQECIEQLEEVCKEPCKFFWLINDTSNNGRFEVKKGVRNNGKIWLVEIDDPSETRWFKLKNAFSGRYLTATSTTTWNDYGKYFFKKD